MLKELLLVFALAVPLACSDSLSRQETADKWKPILVTVNELAQPTDVYQAPLFGNQVSLHLYVLAPSDSSDLTAEVQAPDQQPLTLPLQTLEMGEKTVSSYPGVDLLKFTAVARLPSQTNLGALDPSLAEAQLLRFRYGFLLSDGQRTVPVTGDFPAYSGADIPGAQWNVLGSTISSPEDQAETGQTVTLEADLANPQGEAIKVGWYVSAGELKNRRAESTEWTLPGSGTYTAIMTVRGKQSRTAQLAVRTIKAP